MNWLFPGFLAGATLIGLPVLLHLLRRKPRQVVRFPTLRFLGASALRDTRRNRWWRWLTLALRCLTIVLLCAAFARPFWGQWPGADGHALVIALDNSMSQQARGRWDDTQRWALGQLAALEPGDQAALLVMHPEPHWAVPLTTDLQRVRLALEAAVPGHHKTRYAQPLRMAAQALAGTPAAARTLVWAADEQRAGWRGTDWTQKLPPGVKFQSKGIAPAPQRQAAIIAVRKSSQSVDALEVTIRQFEPAADLRRLTVHAGERELATHMVPLRAGDTPLTVPCTWPVGTAGLRVALEADDLSADDCAWVASPADIIHRVLLDAVPGTDFVGHALRSTHKLDGGGFEPVPFSDHAWPLDYPAVLRHDTSFRNGRLEQLEQFQVGGGAVWVFVGGGSAQQEWLMRQGVRVSARAVEAEPVHLRDWDVEHPVLDAFAGQSLLPLLEVEFYRGFNLTGEALAPIAQWPDGRTAIAELDSGGRRLLIAGFAPDRETTDWVAQPSFVPFVHGAIRWLAALRDTREDWRVDDTIPLPEETGVWRALDGPGLREAVAVNGSVRPRLPGLYEFTGPRMKKVFAVNPPVEESDLSPWPEPERLASLESPATDEATSRVSTVPAGLIVTENRQQLWWWLLAACGCALLAELLMANRTTL